VKNRVASIDKARKAVSKEFAVAAGLFKSKTLMDFSGPIPLV
jgi:hypothetical protein